MHAVFIIFCPISTLRMTQYNGYPLPVVWQGVERHWIWSLPSFSSSPCSTWFVTPSILENSCIFTSPLLLFGKRNFVCLNFFPHYLQYTLSLLFLLATFIYNNLNCQNVYTCAVCTQRFICTLKVVRRGIIPTGSIPGFLSHNINQTTQLNLMRFLYV